jgi:hypothetical protein
LGATILALWGPGWTRLVFFSQTQEVLPQRGARPFAQHRDVGLARSTTAMMAPSGGSLKTRRFAGKKPQGPGARALWGPSCALVAEARVTLVNVRSST